MHFKGEVSSTTSFFCFCSLVMNVAASNNFLSVYNFEKEYVGVWFDPFVLADDDVAKLQPYDVNDLLPFLSQIHSKFNRIWIGIMDNGNKTSLSSTTLIPSAVATYNKLHLEQNDSPLELSINFFVKMENGTGAEKTNFSIGFNAVKELATEANLIYPGTVKTIYLNPIGDEPLDELETSLRIAEKLLHNTGLDLGAAISFQSCWSKQLENILRLVRHISFEWWPNNGNSSEKEYFSNMDFIPSLLFYQCRRRIVKFNEHILIEVQSGWVNENGSESSEQQNEENLVSFWENMDFWALMSNVTVVLTQAFDNPIKENSTLWKGKGWWRLVQNDSYYNSSQYVFEEKKGKPLQEKINGSRSSSYENGESYRISSAVKLAVFLIALGVGWGLSTFKLRFSKSFPFLSCSVRQI